MNHYEIASRVINRFPNHKYVDEGAWCPETWASVTGYINPQDGAEEAVSKIVEDVKFLLMRYDNWTLVIEPFSRRNHSVKYVVRAV